MANLKSWTIQIKFGGSKSPEIFELKNQSPVDRDFKSWSRDIRAGIFQTGFNLPLADGSIECISPYNVHRVILIPEKPTE